MTQSFTHSPATTDGVPAPAAARKRIRVWDLPTRVFHWSLVAAVLTAVITAQVGGAWMRVHGIAGLSIAGLVVFRLVWGFIGSTHARFLSFAPTPKKLVAYVRGRWRGVGHNPLGALSVLALLALLGTQATTGLFSNDDISFSGPLVSLVSDSLSARLTGWHHQIADVLLILIGLHVVAIVFYTWFKKDKLIGPMVSGYKDAETDAPAHQGGGWIAFTLALTAAFAAVYLASGAALPREPVAATAPAVKPASPAW